MFSHVFKNTLKTSLRTKIMVFWAVVFPILLSLMFELALGNLFESDLMKPIDIVVIEPLTQQDQQSDFFKEFLKATSSPEEKIFNISYQSQDEASQLLEDKKVSAIIDFDGQPKITVLSSGINETITQAVMNSYVQNESIIMDIISKNPTTNIQAILELIGEDTQVINNTSSKHMDYSNIYFYTLIGMQLMYGYMWGLTAINNFEANLSTIGKRQSVAPIHKFVAVLAAVLASYLIHLVIMLAMWAWLIFGLNVSFGSQSLWIFILILVGSLTGVSFGVLIGVSNRKSLEFKINLGVAVSMAFSFLAGMMILQIKPWIAKNIPFLAWINPVSLITDALYSLYYYSNLDRYFLNLGILGLLTLVMVMTSFFFIRGKSYEHL